MTSDPERGHSRLRVRRNDDGSYELLDGEHALADANRFLRTLVLRGLSHATVRAYAFDLLVLYRWLGRICRSLDSLTQADLIELVATQQQTNAKPRSINRRLNTTTLLFRFVTGKQLPSSSYGTAPAPHYKGRGHDRYLGLHRLGRQAHRRLRVKVPALLVEPLTAKQVVAFLHSLRRYRDLAIVYLMLFCGLRSQEVLSLATTDLDLQPDELRICGKGQRQRLLPLPQVLRSVLADYRRLERPANPPTTILFVVLQGKRRGQPLSLAGLRSIFRHRRESRSLIRNANAHRFRHTFGADMARAGVTLPVLQRMLGHADLQTTMHYINLSLADVAEQYATAITAIAKRYEQP